MKKYSFEELKRLTIVYSRATEAIRIMAVEIKQLSEIWGGFIRASANDSKLARNCEIAKEK